MTERATSNAKPRTSNMIKKIAFRQAVGGATETGEDDSVDDSIEQWFQDLLMTDDSPLVFYRGFWVDEDLQLNFLNSYPE